jgi:hypothetical protein
MHMYHGHCNNHGTSKENRKHARLMQKANKLGPQDLLEIAAMKGITLIANRQSTAEPSLAADPAVGIGSISSGSASTTGSSGSEAPNAAAVMNDNGIAPPLEVDEMDADGDDALRSVPEIADDDARLGL